MHLLAHAKAKLKRDSPTNIFTGVDTVVSRSMPQLGK